MFKNIFWGEGDGGGILAANFLCQNTIVRKEETERGGSRESMNTRYQEIKGKGREKLIDR